MCSICTHRIVGWLDSVCLIRTANKSVWLISTRNISNSDEKQHEKNQTKMEPEAHVIFFGVQLLRKSLTNSTSAATQQRVHLIVVRPTTAAADSIDIEKLLSIVVSSFFSSAGIFVQSQRSSAAVCSRCMPEHNAVPKHVQEREYGA